MSQVDFDQEVAKIEAEYDRLGHERGWRFLCVSKRVLEADPQIALITANPGGNRAETSYPSASCEHGCAYLVESWGPSKGQHKLQRQVQYLFDALALHAGYSEGGVALMEASLIGYYIPFRSPNLKALHSKKESQAFGQNLWSGLLWEVRPKLIITIDRNAYQGVSTILGAMGGQVSKSGPLKTGWGKATADADAYQVGGQVTKVVRLPHLSTYQLFSRDECQPYIEKILAMACEHLE